LGNIRLAYKSNGITAIHQEDDFTSNTSDWSNPWNGGSITNTNQELNINLLNKWNGTNKAVNITPNEPIHIAFDFDKGSMEKTSLIIKERINGVWESNANRDVFLLQDGHFETHLTLTGDYISIRFEKGNDTDDGTLTTCYVDNFRFDQNNVELLEENNYYPFGLKHKGYNNVINGTDHPYGYNGKEEQNELGLGWIDYDFRNYDASLGRFMNTDPVSPEYAQISPYSYALNNPIVLNDPDGRDWSLSMNWDEENNTYNVSINFKAALLNSSDKEFDTEKLAATIKSALQKAFSGSYSKNNPVIKEVNFNVTTNVEIRQIDNKNELKEDEHLYQVIDTDEGIYGEVDQIGGKEISLNSKYVQSMIDGVDNKTIIHETGHTLGLLHPDTQYNFDSVFNFWGAFNEQRFRPGDGGKINNAMYSGEAASFMNNITTATEINQRQLKIAVDKIRNGDVNKKKKKE